MAVALASSLARGAESESLAQTAQCLVRLGRVTDGHEAIGQALSAVVHADSDAAQFVVGRAAWIVYYETGDMTRSLQHAQDAIAAARRSGDRGIEALMLNNLGLNLAMLGKYDEALINLNLSITTAKAAGWRRQHGYALQNLALVLLAMARTEEARQTVADSMVAFDGTGDDWGVGGSTYYTGLVLEAQGENEVAEQRHQQARDVFLRLGAAGLAAEASAGLARCAVRLGRHQAAVEHADVTMHHMESFGGVGMESPVRAALGCADAFEAVGDAERAQTALRLGKRELTERAERITDAATRATYLAAIAEHRHLLDRLLPT